MEAQGILNSVFDSTNNALRVTAAGDFVYVGAGELELIAGARTLTVTNDVPRLTMVDAATTTFGCTMALPGYWTTADFGFHYTTSATAAGDIRWRMAVKKLHVFVDNISEAFLADVSATVDAPNQGVTFAQLNHLNDVNVTPEAFGTLFSVLISRVGADAADTYTGSAELMGVFAQAV